MPLPQRLQEILDDLALFPGRTDRIEALIAIGEEFKNSGPDVVARTDESRVPGCESEVYVVTQEGVKGKLFRYAVDNPQGISAMALARILELSVNEEDPVLIAQIPDEVIYDIFGPELSMGKSLGLMGMVRMTKTLSARG